MKLGQDLLDQFSSQRRLAGTILRSLPELFEERKRARVESLHHEAQPPRTGFIVDIGAGQGGHGRANLIVDKYIVDSFERSGELDLSRPVVVADGHCLPLKDKSVEYVVSSHVLEHATDPVVFASELSRVAPAGFVQVPSREAELTFGWPFHPWLIDLVDETFIFEPKGDERAVTGDLLHSGFSESPAFRFWFHAHRSRWHHSLEWRGELRVQVTGASMPAAAASFDLEQTVNALENADRKGKLRPLSAKVWSILCCPACHSDIEHRHDRATCTSCDRSYPVAGGVPILLNTVAA